MTDAGPGTNQNGAPQGTRPASTSQKLPEDASTLSHVLGRRPSHGSGTPAGRARTNVTVWLHCVNVTVWLHCGNVTVDRAQRRLPRHRHCRNLRRRRHRRVHRRRDTRQARYRSTVRGVAETKNRRWPRQPCGRQRLNRTPTPARVARKVCGRAAAGHAHPHTRPSSPPTNGQLR